MNADQRFAQEVREILASARQRTPPDGDSLSIDARSLPDALSTATADGRTPIIAEVKPTSPTTDGVRTEDPVTLAEEMVAGGAAAISVLTEPEHFGGSPDALDRVREAVDVPVLRKDFILDESEIDRVEADAVLLIVRFVDDLESLVEAARERGMQPLVEVHTTGELETALETGVDLIGVNNRDLTKLDVDLATFEQVAPDVPDDVTVIAESGIRSRVDARRMIEAGANGLLVGTAIVEGDVRATTEELVAA